MSACDINHHFILIPPSFHLEKKFMWATLKWIVLCMLRLAFLLLFVLSVYSIPSVTRSSGMKTQIVITTNKLISLHHRRQVMLLCVCFRKKVSHEEVTWDVRKSIGGKLENKFPGVSFPWGCVKINFRKKIYNKQEEAQLCFKTRIFT